MENVYTEVRALKQRVERLERQNPQLVVLKSYWANQLAEAVKRDPFKPGERVRYRRDFKNNKSIMWLATVIPVPDIAGVIFPEWGVEGDFIYVIKDDGAIRGVYPWHLARV